MIRFFDFFLSLVGVIILSPIFLIVFIVGLFDTGAPIFFQKRMGRDKREFTLIKFRTMPLDTKSVASHLVNNTPTPLGGFLRKTKLDELPPLINVLKGDMSLVGPRPNLFNQYELIELRDEKGVYNYLPGITGLAQIHNIDMSTPELLSSTDRDMLTSLTVKKYFFYIFSTIKGSGQGDAIK